MLVKRQNGLERNSVKSCWEFIYLRCQKAFGGNRLCDVWVCLRDISQCREKENVEEDG